MKNQNKKTLAVLSQKNPAKRLGETLDKLMAEHKTDGIELSAHSGVPVTTINRLRNGNSSNNPTISTLVPLAAYFNISVSQLLGDVLLTHKQTKKTPASKLQHLPILTWQECIQWPKSQREIYATISTEQAYSKHAYSLLAEENDWEHWHRGMVMIIDPAVTPAHRDYVIVHNKSQTLPSIKQLLHDDSQSYLKPILPGYNTIPLTSQHKILGVVVEYKKQLRDAEIKS